MSPGVYSMLEGHGASMDIERHNQDLRILQREAPLARFGAEPPGWRRVEWRPTSHGGNMVLLEELVLPGVCSPRRADLRVEAPPNLYDRAPSGEFYFYRNIWLSCPGLKVWDRRTRCWKPVPRLHAPSPGSRFAYLCIHPGLASRQANILDLLRVFDLHLLNPGLHATGEETL